MKCSLLLHIKQCMGVILEKFKEKKQNVVQALREASDAIFASGVSALLW